MSAVTPEDLSAAPASLVEKIHQHMLTGGLAGLGFFLLFGIAGVYISMFVLLLACCLAPSRIWQQRPWRLPYVACGLVFLAYIALRTFVGEGLSSKGVKAVNSYQELLVFPVLWAIFRVAPRPQVFTRGLIAGALLAAVGVWVASLQLLGHLPWQGAWLQMRLDHSIEIRRISIGFGLSICAYLLFEHARLRRLPPVIGYALAAFLAITVLFAGEGRTGHLILLVLVGCAAYRAAPRKWRYPAAFGVLAAGMLVAACSTAVRTRMAETVAVLHGTPAPASAFISTRTRVEMLQTGIGVARENWLFGSGWVGYANAFRKTALERNPAMPDALGSHSNNPHNEYLLQLGAGGLPALLLFLLWVGWPIWLGWRESGPDRPWIGTAACVALAFAVGSAFNSLLFDFIEGHMYVAVMAWLLVRRVDRS